jgi:hypothetical protein
MKQPQNACRVWGVTLAGVKGLLRSTLVSLVPFVIACLPSVLSAQIRTQPEDSAVVFRVESPFNEAGGLQQAIKMWRASPNDIAIATSSAKIAFLEASRHGELRWLGTARAMLDPWWARQDIAGESLFVRALVRQGMHDFEGALADLNAAIAYDASQAQYWAWRFAVYMVRSETQRASAECQAIGERFGRAERDGCRAVLSYRTGDAFSAVETFRALTRHPDYQGENAQEWLAFHLGEALRVAGNVQSAQRIWRTFLKEAKQSHGIRVALIDSLTKTGDFSAAWALNKDPQRSDALLVSALQVALALNNGQDAVLRAEIEQRLKQRELRGESLNERPFIKYYLYVRQDPTRALTMAKESWKTEREPADALLFAKAAVLAGQPSDASSVVQWQLETGYREPELDQVLDQIKHATSSKGRP